MAVGNDDLVTAAQGLNSGAIHLLRAMRNVDAAAGLTPARLSALSVLVFGGPSTLGRLAAAEDVAGPTMTRIVDGLVALGLAERSVHPDSRRMSRIEATEAGRDLMMGARDARIDRIVAAMEGLGAKDRAALVRAAPALQKLAAAARGMDD